jgi:hypothetical protein
LCIRVDQEETPLIGGNRKTSYTKIIYFPSPARFAYTTGMNQAISCSTTYRSKGAYCPCSKAVPAPADPVTLPNATPANSALLLSALSTGTGPFMLASFYWREDAIVSRVILITTVVSVLTVSVCLLWLGG